MRGSSLNARRTLPLFAALLLVGGCAGLDGKAGGQGPSMEDLGRIRVGSTSAADVKALLGQPVRVTRFDRMDRDVWEYRRYNDPTDEYHIAVQFSSDGIVREVLVLKEYNREPCGT
jgi:outer membrane protein assembly factor BamE (lipoprotein component of BamABCDE complex)